MTTYYVRFSATLEGETSIEANDVREAIDLLDREFFSQKVFEDISPSTFLIESIGEE